MIDKNQWVEVYEDEWLPLNGTKAYENRVKSFLDNGHTRSEAITLTEITYLSKQEILELNS